MKIILVAATPPESRIIRNWLGIDDAKVGVPQQARHGDLDLELIHTGIGMVNTAYRLGNYFSNLEQKPLLAIQFGIAGAFPGGALPGDGVEVVEEIFSEMGAESPDGFLDLEKMGFENFNVAGQPVYNRLVNARPSNLRIPRVSSITVNKVHGLSNSIQEAQQLWTPEVENMEGAAFFQACLLSGIPFLEFRGISNVVEVRNRASWRIPEAIQAASDLVIAHLGTFY